MPRELLFIDLPKIMFESQDCASESSRFSIHLLTKIRLELTYKRLPAKPLGWLLIV